MPWSVGGFIDVLEELNVGFYNAVILLSNCNYVLHDNLFPFRE